MCTRVGNSKPAIMEKCVSSKSTTATAMAIASRALRPCDVCGRERAKWYCKADEAYLCEHCDGSVHGANAVSQRHERVRLAPNGTLLKNVKRVSSNKSQHGEDHVQTASKSHHGSRKRPRSARCQKVKAEPPSSPKAAATTEEDFFNSFVAASPESDELLVTDSAHEVPIFMPLVHDFSDDVPSDGFIVPSQGKTEVHEGVELCFDPFLDAEGDLCDMDGIISGGIDMETISDLGGVLGLCDDSNDLCGEEYGIEFPTDPSEDEDATTPDAEDATTPDAEGPKVDFCTKIKLEESDDLEKIKLEVDEMLGYAFSANNSVKEEEVEHKRIKLRLNYEDVLSAWSDRGSFWTEGARPQTVPDISSFDPTCTWDSGLVPDLSMEGLRTGEAIGQVPVVNFGDERMSSSRGREARVLRYREKRRTRLFSKKIRYEVRKLNAERRPRLKGRFVKRISV